MFLCLKVLVCGRNSGQNVEGKMFCRKTYVNEVRVLSNYSLQTTVKRFAKVHLKKYIKVLVDVIAILYCTFYLTFCKFGNFLYEKFLTKF